MTEDKPTADLSPPAMTNCFDFQRTPQAGTPIGFRDKSTITNRVCIHVIEEIQMAQKTLIQFVDDLDGSALADGTGKTVTFALEGVSYEIDLSQAHAEELAEALAPYVAAGRKVGGRKSAARTSGAKSDPAELQKIRDWAGKNGHAVSSRGRISAAVRDAYNAAR